MCNLSQKKLCGSEECDTCYSRSFATHSRASFWSLSNKLKPHEVLLNSNKKYLFDCNDCGHQLEMVLKNVAFGQWCKYCNSDGLCENNSCEFCYKKSFASHPMASRWSPNNDITPRQILRGSDKKFWFDCVDCGHSFQSVLYSISRGTKCPFCTSQQLCDKDDCKLCFDKSCASHEISKAWSSENEIQPRQMFLQSNKKIKFICLKCDHLYETHIQHYINRKGSCPYCSNKYLCDKDECSLCFNKSFASHPQIHCWSNKNHINPRMIFKGSETRCIFDCDKCNSEFESRAYNILTGYWCPFCRKKTEAKVSSFLKLIDGDWKAQLRFDWCKFSSTGNIMPFDFGSSSKKILIEIDGAQHFTQIANWDSPELVCTKDIEKIYACISNGYSIIHISQEDIWKEIYDWKKILLDEINRLETVENNQCSFISKNNIYSSHISKLDASINYIVKEILS
jgi:very-short-patch-repair endonuclease